MTTNELEARIRRLEDIEEIKMLQSRYQHFIHTYDWEGIVDLFAKKAPDVSAEIGQSGLFVGTEGIKRFFTERMPSPRRGRKGTLLFHIAVNPVIEVSKDGKTAKAVWLSPGIETSGQHNLQCWGWGKYYCDYIKEDGKWKFWHLKWYQTFETPIEKGWIHQQEVGVIGTWRTPEFFPPDKPSTYHMPYRER